MRRGAAKNSGNILFSVHRNGTGRQRAQIYAAAAGSGNEAIIVNVGNGERHLVYVRIKQDGVIGSAPYFTYNRGAAPFNLRIFFKLFGGVISRVMYSPYRIKA